MAKKQESEPKVVVERVYNVPLRRGFIKTSKNKKTNKAIKTLREFISRHMKSSNVKIGPGLNQLIWTRGSRRPPHHVKVMAVKDDTGKVAVELEGYTPKKVQEKPEQKKKATKKEPAKKEDKPKALADEKKEPKKEQKPLEEKKEEKPKAEKKAAPKQEKKEATSKDAEIDEKVNEIVKKIEQAGKK